MKEYKQVGRAWLSLYPQHVGPNLSLDHGDMLSLFRARVAADGQAPAYRYFDQSRSFAELDADSDALATWLAEQGVTVGDRVSIILQNIPAFPIATIAAWKLGAVPVPGNPMYRASELARILADAQPNVVICQDVEQAEMAAALVLAGLDAPLLVASPRDGQERDAAILPPRVVPAAATLADVLRDHAGRLPERIECDPNTIGLILYTSGTTGQPKGAMIAHSGLAHNAQFTRDWCGIAAEGGILAIAPLFHITGFVCHLCAGLSAGAPMVLFYRFDPATVVELARRWRPVFTIGAITAFNALMRLPGIAASDLVSLSSVFTGGAPVPPALKRDIERALSLRLHTCYGMTETAAPAIFTPPGLDAPVSDDTLSIGIPIPSTQIKVIDETGVEVPTGVAGEILIKGPGVMTGYWRMPEETAAALSEGWMRSGDVGMMDTDGWIYLVDRKKDVIIASGFKVWPREVEDTLYAHPAVREAAVVGVADPYRGETVKAFVSLVDGAELDPAMLIAHCRDRLAAYKVPRLVEVLPDLPKTVTGKIQRVALR